MSGTSQAAPLVSGGLALVKQEFNGLNKLYTSLKAKHPDFKTISMGMSGDYLLAISEGSTMVRIGSSIFGSR